MEFDDESIKQIAESAKPHAGSIDARSVFYRMGYAAGRRESLAINEDHRRRRLAAAAAILVMGGAAFFAGRQFAFNGETEIAETLPKVSVVGEGQPSVLETSSTPGLGALDESPTEPSYLDLLDMPGFVLSANQVGSVRSVTKQWVIPNRIEADLLGSRENESPAKSLRVSQFLISESVFGEG